MKQKRISILGSTGSIGRQTLDVIEELNSDYIINYLTVNKNIDLLEEQIIKYQPKGIVISDKEMYDHFKKTSSFKGKILFGKKGLIEAMQTEKNDLVISALVGFSGVEPTLAAIKSGSDVALANKETLVSAGSVITSEAHKNNVKIIAVDSEHSAILQCLAGENESEIEKLVLTASGGPFRETSIDEFKYLTVKQALNHPNWSMGSKITIDSATMMNKGFEVIEAYWLFDVNQKQIDVVVHPQSIIHSMVQFIDGSVKAQLGLPDMRIPISYALNFPKRFKYNFPRMDITKIGSLTFEKPDLNRFRCLEIAYHSLELGGNAPAIVNAANEVAVSLFLEEKINFNQISELIDNVLNVTDNIKQPDLDDIINSDKIAREKAVDIYNNLM